MQFQYKVLIFVAFSKPPSNAMWHQLTSTNPYTKKQLNPSRYSQYISITNKPTIQLHQES